MSRARRVVRRRPATSILVVFAVIVALGSTFYGPSFAVSTLPLPSYASSVWYTVNAILFGFTAYLTWRNLNTYLNRWTWQERAVSRGLLVILAASCFGLSVRAFDEPAMTLATPLYTVGLAFLLYGLVGKPYHLNKGDEGHGSTS